MAVGIQVEVCTVTPCSAVVGPCCVHLHPEAARSSKKSVSHCTVTQRHNAEDLDLN